MIESGWTIHPASPGDQHLLRGLIESAPHLHQHLDWTGALDLLSEDPFLLATEGGLPVGCMAAPVEASGLAWIRLFAVASGYNAAELWFALWNRARRDLAERGTPDCAVLCVSPWLQPLVEGSGFQRETSIVFLEYQAGQRRPETIPAADLRPMRPEDLELVHRIDNRAFGYLWKMGEDALRRALEQSSYATIARVDGQTVGYQMTTWSVYGAHLARLAVEPGVQGRGIGADLVKDLLGHFSRQGASRVTVNTQSDNQSSLKLYRNLGFQPTGNEYPVYLLRLTE